MWRRAIPLSAGSDARGRSNMRKSTIKALPKEIRTELDKRLAEGKLTLDTLTAFIRGHGHEVSRSAVGRYANEFEAVASKMREAREVSAAFAKELGAIPNDDFGRVLAEMLHTLTFRVMLGRTKDDTADVDPKELMFLSSALKNAATTTKMSAELEMKIRTEEKKRLEEEMKKKIATAEKSGGLDTEAAQEALRILGFN